MSWLRHCASIGFWGAFCSFSYLFVASPIQDQKVSLAKEINILEKSVANLKLRTGQMTNSGFEHAFPAELFLLSGSQIEAELALQNVVLDLAEQYEITLVAFGTTSFTRDTTQKTIAFELESESPLGELLAFLAAVETLTPKTAIATLRMRPTQSYDTEYLDDILIYSQITFWSFWDITP
ncbi:hypothetical protein [Epibacterium ulvae]|uniref:hypothetical protein n=1 Tax=Epibacterium ulvae TaxID=1156985 RepID=UPI002492CE38|nr:hypothetical protein [Epibacterium ulvae]